MKDRDVLFHEKWLGLAQPIEGLVFSVPVLADAQIAPELRVELSTSFASHVADPEAPKIRDLRRFLREFLGYDQPGMLVDASTLPADLSFYAAEGGQEIRPTFALGRGPFISDDPFAMFEEPPPATPTDAAAPGPDAGAGKPWFALVWDLTGSAVQGETIDLDAPETTTGAWRYTPTAKFERLLRHVGIPVGLLFNGPHLRLVYAPSGESTGHLTFRVEHMVRPDGRPLLAGLDLLLHARRAYSASAEHKLEGLLAESRRRQADVTEALAKQVFEAVEILVAGFEAAAARDITPEQEDWLRRALEQEGDHFYQGVLSVVLRLVFLLYSEDQGLLPVEHPIYAEHLSLSGLHQRLSHDAGAHPESMHHRFGAYGQLLSLFRAVFFGVKHGTLELPARRGRLFDPNAYPFLEGGLPWWTAAVAEPEARAQARPPSLDDGTIHRVLHRLVMFEGQRLSYRTLDVEQIGSVYESLMGYHVVRLGSPAVRMGKHGVWVETHVVREMSASERARFFKETCGMNPGPIASLERLLKEVPEDVPGESMAFEALSTQAMGRKADIARHRAPVGQLVLQPGEERRRTASHYTPRSLTEKVVRRTLEPLLACLGEDRTPEQILQLKICDPAMGSGAFLVATCRALASEIEAAWTRRGELAGIIEQHGDAHLHARRLVAQKCLYGVDKNPAAVELAKLSLWLITLSKRLPFTFVDHSLRHGDSLVGLDFKQIEAFHWSPPGQVETCRVLLKEALGQAVGLRQEILALADREDEEAQTEKRRLLEFAEQAIERVRVVADVCVGAFFSHRADREKTIERDRRLAAIERWLAGDSLAEDTVLELALNARASLFPFHWWIEFPEVFFDARPDPLEGGITRGAAFMEGVLGNPPYGGKNTVIGSSVPGYIEWLQSIHVGSHGNSDIAAHFLLRSCALLGNNGALGVVVTKTVCQGDTRLSGLARMLESGWRIYDSTGPVPWPGAAGVTIVSVHAARGVPAVVSSLSLNGVRVPWINSRLRPTPERPDPRPLFANGEFIFQGTIVLGMGFTLSPEARDVLTSPGRESNAERIFPYIGGEEVTSSPTQAFERYVIGFGQLGLTEVEARWPELLAIVREKVKPERDKQADNVDGRRRKQFWWQFGRETPALVESIRDLDRCLVTLFTAKHLTFSFQPTARVFANTLWVLPISTFSSFAVLQSRVHEAWVRLLSSSLEDRLRYTASDCFVTFAFPCANPNALISSLEEVGRMVESTRARVMVDSNEGLTKIYNALKDPTNTDPRILHLRTLHESMDRAVLDAYGWTDIPVPPYCPLTDADKQAVQAFEDEVIDRLYVLNAERAREEARLGLSGKKPRATAEDPDAPEDAASRPAKKPRGKKSSPPSSTDPTGKPQRKLFE